MLRAVQRGTSRDHSVNLVVIDVANRSMLVNGICNIGYTPSTSKAHPGGTFSRFFFFEMAMLNTILLAKWNNIKWLIWLGAGSPLLNKEHITLYTLMDTIL